MGSKKKLVLGIWSIVISILVNMDVTKIFSTDVVQAVTGLDSSNHVLLMLSKALYSVTQMNVISFAVIAFLSGYIINYVNEKERLSYLTIALNILFAIILSTYLVYGEIFKSNVNDEVFTSGKTSIFLVLLNISGVSLFLSLCIAALEKYIKYHLVSFGNKDQVNDNYSFKWKKEFLIIFMCWLPYMLILYPGVCSWDTMNQLHEFFGSGHSIFDVYPIGHYLISNKTFTISNQHNFFVTLFYGFNFKIGYYLFHNANIGLFISAFIQSVVYISVLTYSLLTLKRIGTRQKLLRIFRWIYALFPVFPILSLFLVKNVLYSAFLLWFILLLAQGIINDGSVNSKRWQIGFWLAVLLQLATEKYAVYIIILLVIIFAFSTSGRLRKIIVMGMVIPLCLFVVSKGVLFSALNVSNGDPIEGKVMMIQQTALYVKRYPNGLTSYQNKVINKVFVKKNLGKLYDPGWADPIKSSGGKYPHFVEGYRYKTVTRSDMRQYNKVWLQMFRQHPLVYIEAFLNESYGYLDANYTVVNASAKDQGDSLPVSHTDFQIAVGEKQVFAGLSNHCLLIRKIIASAYNVLHQILPFSLFLNGNIYVICMIFLFLLLISLKLYRTILIIMPLLLQIPVLLLSPVNGSQRYMYPIIVAFVSVLGIIVTIVERKKIN